MPYHQCDADIEPRPPDALQNETLSDGGIGWVAEDQLRLASG